MIERLVLGIARARHPWLTQIFGMSQELLARDNAVERAELERLEARVFGPGGLRAFDERPLLQACRMGVASALGKRSLQSPGMRWVRVAANVVGLVPLVMGLALSSRRPRGTPAAATFCFLPAERYGEEARRVLGEDTVATADKRPLLSLRVLRFLARAVWTEPRLIMVPEVLSNALRWLSYYEHSVAAYRPRVLGNFAEGVTSMPLVTLYMREIGVRSVNLQHGERLVNRQVAFMLFDECYFWSAKYAQVYADSRSLAEDVWLTGNGLHRRLARERAGWAERPRRLVVIHHRIPDMPKSYSDGVLRLARALCPDWEVSIRPHPQDGGLFRELAEHLEDAVRGREVQIEHAQSVALFDVVIRARIVVGATSTAIIESWIGGAKVVLVPGMAKRESAMEPYGGSPNVLWLDDDVGDEQLAEFVLAERKDDADERARVDRVSLVSSDQPIKWRGAPS